MPLLLACSEGRGGVARLLLSHAGESVLRDACTAQMDSLAPPGNLPGLPTEDPEDAHELTEDPEDAHDSC